MAKREIIYRLRFVRADDTETHTAAWIEAQALDCIRRRMAIGKYVSCHLTKCDRDAVTLCDEKVRERRMFGANGNELTKGF